MTMHIDQSVYPDLDVPPIDLPDDFAKADYLHRVCTAWDFGVVPERAAFDLFGNWRSIFDRFPVVCSPAYHALRATFGWEPVARPPELHAPTLRWEHLDRIEGRGPDPCENLI